MVEHLNSTIGAANTRVVAKPIATIARTSPTITRASVLSTSLNRSYRTMTSQTAKAPDTSSLNTPTRYNMGDAAMRCAVAAASPRTKNAEGMYTSVKAPGSPIAT